MVGVVHQAPSRSTSGTASRPSAATTSQSALHDEGHASRQSRARSPARDRDPSRSAPRARLHLAQLALLDPPQPRGAVARPLAETRSSDQAARRTHDRLTRLARDIVAGRRSLANSRVGGSRRHAVASDTPRTAAQSVHRAPRFTHRRSPPRSYRARVRGPRASAFVDLLRDRGIGCHPEAIPPTTPIIRFDHRRVRLAALALSSAFEPCPVLRLQRRLPLRLRRSPRRLRRHRLDDRRRSPGARSS